MNYDDRNDDEENLIYEESPPDFPDGMSIYEPENMDDNSKSTDDGTENPGPSKKLLKRDMLAIALKRLEDSARTENDFRDIINWWDRTGQAATVNGRNAITRWGEMRAESLWNGA